MATPDRTPPAEDTFLRFVRAVADSLDDPHLTGDELARQAHLSRYHFDRVIRSVAGEPPAAFRRRILLERAAYRMISGRGSILDAAVEAGYTSNESFTRAFERAYGRAPSRWRARPEKFQLPAPNHVHFHPPAGLRLPGEGGAEAGDLVVAMVRHHAWLVAEMVRLAAALDDTALDAPLRGPVDGIDGENLRWLLSRLIGQMHMWTAAMDDVEYDFTQERQESTTAMRRRIAHVGPAFVEQVRRVSAEGRFDETFVDAMREEAVVVTYGGMVAHVLTFAAHHRLLALDVLREHGLNELAYGDPKFWVAENPDPGPPGRTDRSDR